MLQDLIEWLVSWAPRGLLHGLAIANRPLVRYRAGAADAAPITGQHFRGTQPERAPRDAECAPRRATYSSDKRIHSARSATPAKARAASPANSSDASFRDDWLEFSYQPKIDLQRGALAGVEILPMVRHPQAGLLTPDSFLPHSGQSERYQFGVAMVRAALKAWEPLRRMGFAERLSISVPVDVITQREAIAILRDERPKDKDWPGLVLELPTSDAMPTLAALHDFISRVGDGNIHLALNGLQPTDVLDPALRRLPIAEVKLWSAFLTRAQADPIMTHVCRALVDFIHACRATAVVAGLEQVADLVCAKTLGFDVAQGDLLCAPMTRAALAPLLQKQSKAAGQPS